MPSNNASSAPPKERFDWDSRLIRYEDLIPCRQAFIDTRTPGSDKKENFCLIGPGVAENPLQHVHIAIAHGFNIGGARQPPGCKNSHHSHDTEEVFVVHEGRWKFTWGVNGEDGSAVLEAGDTISIPMKVFRGFENVGDDDGFLFAVLGGDDPGHVTWAPYVFHDAKAYGLVLLQDGRLIDTAAGEAIPADGTPEHVLTEAEVRQFRRMSAEEMAECVLRNDELTFRDDSALGQFPGVAEAAVLGPDSPAERLGAGRMAWRHGFHARRLRLDAGAAVPPHTRFEEEVIFVHRGSLTIGVDAESRTLGPGDLFTTPIGVSRRLENGADELCDLIVVRGGDAPAAPRWDA